MPQIVDFTSSADLTLHTWPETAADDDVLMLTVLLLLLLLLLLMMMIIDWLMTIVDYMNVVFAIRHCCSSLLLKVTKRKVRVQNDNRPDVSFTRTYEPLFAILRFQILILRIFEFSICMGNDY